MHRLAEFNRRAVRLHHDRHQHQSRAARHLPGPSVEALRARVLAYRAVFVLLRAHQRHHALVHLGLGIDYLKYPLRARERREQRRHLLRHLAHRLRDLPPELEVDRQPAQVKHAAKGEQAAHDGRQRVADIHHVAHDGHHGRGVEVRVLGHVKVGVIERAELRLRRVFVREGLDHAQALYHLLDIAVHLAQRALLLLIQPAASPAYRAYRQETARQHQQRYEKQRRAGHDEYDHDAHERQARGEYRHYALLQHLLHIVRVVGKAAHELAVRVLVEEGQGQLLQLVKELRPELVRSPVRQLRHDGRLFPHFRT